VSAQDGLESALASSGEQLDATLKAAAAVTRELKKAKAATGSGQLRELRLFDEVELIGRYSLLQPGRSYAELARWLDGDAGEVDEPLVTVAAMTDDFEAAVLTGKNDREILPGRLRDKQTHEYTEMASLAQAGMQHIERDTLALVPPDVQGIERLGATRMRQYVRAWINEWDLIRLDPDYRPATQVLDVASDYREQAGLQGPDAD